MASTTGPAPTGRAPSGRTPTGSGPLARVRQHLDRPLASYQLVLGSVSMLVGLGLIAVLSASSVLSYYAYDGNSFAIVQRQATFAVLGIVGAWLATRVPIPVLRRLVLPALVVSVLLMLALFIPGVGITINGNRNWLPIGFGQSVQPSEFAKLALILWIADLYARRQHLMRRPRYILMPMILVGFAVAGLVVLQDDLGTALVLFCIILGMLWVAGLPARYLGVLLAGLGVVCLYFVATAPYRVARMLNFLNPLADPDRDGYQSIQAMMGFARGGIAGVGLGKSRQKWGSLPEAHTDFILAVIGEELGLLGTLVVLGLFMTLVVAGVRIALRTRQAFVRYAAAGITIWFAAQTVINIGMVLGLLPVIGIPLPFLSYGGSSLIVTLLAAGLLLSFATTEPGAAAALRAGRARRRRRAAARRR